MGKQQVLGPRIWAEVTRKRLLDLCHNCNHHTDQMRVPRRWECYIAEILGEEYANVDRLNGDSLMLWGVKFVFDDTIYRAVTEPKPVVSDWLWADTNVTSGGLITTSSYTASSNFTITSANTIIGATTSVYNPVVFSSGSTKTGSTKG